MILHLSLVPLYPWIILFFLLGALTIFIVYWNEKKK